jgi:hypothetical protein
MTLYPAIPIVPIGVVIVKCRDETDTTELASDRRPTHVVSIGVRGGPNDPSAQVARLQLEYWLGQHRDQYRIAGKARFLSHPDPLLRPTPCLGELQLPIRAT